MIGKVASGKIKKTDSGSFSITKNWGIEEVKSVENGDVFIADVARSAVEY